MCLQTETTTVVYCTFGQAYINVIRCQNCTIVLKLRNLNMNEPKCSTRECEQDQQNWFRKGFFSFFWWFLQYFPSFVGYPELYIQQFHLVRRVFQLYVLLHRFFRGGFSRIFHKIRLFTEVRAYNQEIFYYFQYFGTSSIIIIFISYFFLLLWGSCLYQRSGLECTKSFFAFCTSSVIVHLHTDSS